MQDGHSILNVNVLFKNAFKSQCVT